MTYWILAAVGDCAYNVRGHCHARAIQIGGTACIQLATRSCGRANIMMMTLKAAGVGA